MRRLDPPEPGGGDLVVDRFVGRLVEREAERVEEAFADGLRVEDVPLERDDRVPVVEVEAGSSPPAGRRPVISRFTWRVSSSILLVSRSTSVWLAVRFTLACTCCRLD